METPQLFDHSFVPLLTAQEIVDMPGNIDYFWQK